MEVALNALQLLHLEGNLTRSQIRTKLGENDSLVYTVMSLLVRKGFASSELGRNGGYHIPSEALKRPLSELFSLFDKRYLPNPTRSSIHASERVGRLLYDAIHIPLKHLFSG